MHYQRTLSNFVKKAIQLFKIVIITGPHQVGKTSIFLSHKDPNRTEISLDDVEALTLAKQNPAAFVEKYKPPVLIKQIQRAPELLSFILNFVDSLEDKGLFCLTSSRQLDLEDVITNCPTGKIVAFNLQGFSHAEKQYNYNRGFFTPDLDLQTRRPVWTPRETFDSIYRGSFPQVYEGSVVRDVYYDEYLNRYLLREVKDLIHLENEKVFLDFLKILAKRITTVLDYTRLSEMTGINLETVELWIDILKRLNMIYLLPLYPAEDSKILANKVYFMDSGLCTYLCDIHDVDALSESPLNGLFIENYSMSEVVKSYIHNYKTPHLYYYKVSETEEIGLIIKKSGKLYPITINKSALPSVAMANGFDSIDPEKKGIGGIIGLSRRFCLLNKDVFVIPVSYI